MCGRFAFTPKPEQLKVQFQLSDLPEILPQYNIAPSQNVLTIVQMEGANQALMLRWGLIPFWSSDEKRGNGFANARSETVHQKPSFRNSFKSKRCLLLMSGFFEWQLTERGKQPYYIKPKNEEVLAIAALWDSWQAKEAQEVIHSCCLLTTSANEFITPIHDRMPVILNQENQARWLNRATPTNDLLDLLKPYPNLDLDAYPVSTKVNNGRYQGVDTLSPI